MSTYKIHQGDCLESLEWMPDNSVDSIVTDPPYGLSFMNKRWDYDVPSEAVWRECLRVLKPGGYLLSFGGSRTYHRLACKVEDGGFEIRDQIMWVYGSGFPKSHNGHWGGTALKPAHEPILMARKPLVGTVERNVELYGTGGLNVDGCRVPTDDKLGGGAEKETTVDQKGNDGWTRPWMENAEAREAHAARVRLNVERAESMGRWPANLIHDGSDEVLAAFPAAKGQQGATGKRTQGVCYGDVDGGREGVEPRGDCGSAARFFYCPKASKADRDEGLDDAPDRILAMSNQAKAQLARGVMHEAESGMNTAKVRKNNHPTVKPTELMRYLVRLVTPKGGVVLDHYMGSGSTGKAALMEGFRFIGMEQEPEYVAIAVARLKKVLADQEL